MTAMRQQRLEPAEFDVCGELPEGVTVLEASAGTGKTYTIAALAARFVAEGRPLHEMLLITFTRMATGELRDRVRERLVSCEEQLSRMIDGVLDPAADDVVKLLATGTQERVEQRRNNLVRAIATFDSATIATTHGFCQEVLAELGTIGDLEPRTQFVENVSELVEEVVDDLYVRRFQKRGDIQFSRADAMVIARAAVENPGNALEPQQARGHPVAEMRFRLATKIREELEHRKRQMAIMTYDDLLTRLNATLGGPSGPAAVARLRSRYKVVLVDEFQDTDPVQWQILHRAFAATGTTLVLIADPKQAIYAFRGADVYAYLLAAQTATTRATLPVNRRSDQSLLSAFDALFDDATLGHPGIVYRRVRAAPAHEQPRLIGAPEPAALRVRVVPGDEPGIERTPSGLLQTQAVRQHIAHDVANDIVRLLTSGARLQERDPDGSTASERQICAGDIAVLVRANAQANLVRTALEEARVPAVINGAGSVFATRSARDWLRLLDAIDRPAATSRARAAALTPFIGWDAAQVATAGEADWDGVHRRLHRWNRVLRQNGVAELMETIMNGEGLPARVLGNIDGERQLTDLRHLAQLLHGAASAERLGPTALRGWLAQQMAVAELQDGEEERTRRLESDAEAVQILTVHRSKGLEFPVVYCPFLWWAGRSSRDAEPVTFHDPQNGDKATTDVGLEGPSYQKHKDQHHLEERGEELRLAYVALTRAKHQAVTWWAGVWDSQHSPLGRILLARDEHGYIRADGGRRPDDDATVLRRLDELQQAAPGCISVERTSGATRLTWSPPAEQRTEIATAVFDRHLDLRWRRTSYSDITSAAHDPLVASEPEEVSLHDEPETPTPVPAVGATPAELALPSPLGRMPVGVTFGTLVHRVFEAADFAAADLDAELTGHIEAAATRRRLDLGSTAEAVAGLRAAIETPLGPLVDGRRLRDLERPDRLDELTFELPLVGGDDPTGRLTLDAIAAVLRAHLAPGDPLAAYAGRLEDPALRSSVRGFLTGSIDLVARIPDPPAAGAPDVPNACAAPRATAPARYVIADYKTNWLGGADEELTLGHYTPAALASEMSRAHYGLQALLYTVALHRYLRWRQPGYDPGHHLAGVLYLFLRGMAGADTPVVDGTPCGVFAWRPPAALVLALSDVLDQGGSRW